jgi:AraC-like DNA-binding protein
MTPSKPYSFQTAAGPEKSIGKTQAIAYLLNRFMRDQRPYLKVRYTIRHLASDLETPAYLLSAFINQELGVNFNDYFNQFRVRHCQVLMQDCLVEEFNLRGLARVCGFTNRNTFTAAFKKFTGMPPSVYKKNLDKGDVNSHHRTS